MAKALRNLAGDAIIGGVPAPVIVQCDNCGKKNRVPAVAAGLPRCGHCQASLPWIAEADDESYRAVVERAKVPVLVDLWAPWCGPCKVVSPALEQLARERAGKLKLVKIDVDTSPRISTRFDVRGIPTLMVVVDGRVVDRHVGAAPEAALRQWLETALARRPTQPAGPTAGPAEQAGPGGGTA
ncbi:MAG TPA: thioredoxin [Acidimicrobiales bacterium]